MMKIMIRAIVALILMSGLLVAVNAIATEDISVLKVDTLVMEKGAETYSVSVKAFVKNNGETDDITVKVVGVDINGYELQNATLSGPIEQGKTRVLIGVVKVPKDVYQEIVRWEWKK